MTDLFEFWPPSQYYKVSKKLCTKNGVEVKAQQNNGHKVKRNTSQSKKTKKQEDDTNDEYLDEREAAEIQPRSNYIY